MRTRLSTEQRRAQLLAIGAELFAARPYDEVWIEEVAEIAQVSRGLLYHYFPAKRDFFLEVLRVERDRLLELSAPDPELAPVDQLVAGLEVYLEYAATHPQSYRVAHRTALAADAETRAIVEVSIAAQYDRILAGLATLMPVDDVTRFAVRGWLRYVPVVTLDWLDDPVITRDELRDLCVRMLLAAVRLDL